MGVADVEAGRRGRGAGRAARPGGRAVVDVPAHGGECTARRRRRSSTPLRHRGRPARGPSIADRCPPIAHPAIVRYTRCRYIASIYRTDQTGRSTVLDLAILGLLKEQPLHGYELKKRLGETLGLPVGHLLRLALPGAAPARARRRHRDVDAPARAGRADPATGSLDGDLAAARPAPPGHRPSRRTRKAYRITERASAASWSCSSPTTPPPTTSAAFALKLAFCRHLSPTARLVLLERAARRLAPTGLAEARARSATAASDRYTRSLARASHRVHPATTSNGSTS